MELGQRAQGSVLSAERREVRKGTGSIFGIEATALHGVASPRVETALLSSELICPAKAMQGHSQEPRCDAKARPGIELISAATAEHRLRSDGKATAEQGAAWQRDGEEEHCAAEIINGIAMRNTTKH